MDKFNDFNGFFQVFHRNPKGASFCHGKTVENSDFRPIIPVSFPQLHVLHIINRLLHAGCGLRFDGPANVVDIALQEWVLLHAFFDFVDGIGDGAVVFAEELANGWQAHRQ